MKRTSSGERATPPPDRTDEEWPSTLSFVSKSRGPRPPVEALQDGRRMAGRQWKPVQRLGSGPFGDVWKMRCDEEEQAWKFVKRSPDGSVDDFRSRVPAGVKHPSVVCPIHVAESGDHFIVRMKLVHGRSLESAVTEEGVLPPLMACRHALQLASALQALHEADVLHLGVKPSNVLLRDDGDRVMVTDAGLCSESCRRHVELDSERLRHAPRLAAPEQIDGKTEEDRLGPTTDVWGLGVTLYYMLSGNYPFPIEDREVLTSTEPPTPLNELVPYADADLWSVLERMLALDPQDRLANMTEVHSAFTHYLTEITCPACGRSFQAEHVQGMCPEVTCPNPDRIIDLKERRQLMRQGHTFFSRCMHRQAIEAYGKVVEMDGSGEQDLTARAKRLIAEAEADEKALERRLSVLKATRDSGDFLRVIKEIDRTRATRFSAARALIDLRREVMDTIQARYENLPQTTSELVKEMRFADIKLLLTQIEGLLDYPPTHRLLKEWEAEHPDATPVLQDLFTFVADREAFLRDSQKEVTRSLNELDMDGAIEALQRVQKHFPEEKNLERIRAFAKVQEALELIRPHDAASLDKLLSDKDRLQSGERVELKRIREECEFVLEQLKEEKIEKLKEIEERREHADRIIRELEVRVDRLQAKADAAEKENSLRKQTAALQGLAAIAERTDVLSHEEAARISANNRRHREVLERAETKYREGIRLIEQRNFGKAQVCLESAERMAPGVFPEIVDRLRDLEEIQERTREAGDQLYRSYNRIMGETAKLEDFQTFFRLYEESMGQLEQRTMLDVGKRTNRVFSRLFTLQAHAIRKSSRASSRLDILRQTAEALAGEPERWLTVGLMKESSELNERALDFFGAVFDRLDHASKTSLGKTSDTGVVNSIEHVHGIIDEMDRIKSAVKAITPREHHPHPAERASQLLAGFRGAAFRAPEPRSRLTTLLHLQETLLGFASDESTKKHIQRNAAAVKRTIRRADFDRTLGRLKQLGIRMAIPLIALAIGAAAATLYQWWKSDGAAEPRIATVGDEAATRLGAGIAERLKPLLAGGSTADELSRALGRAQVRLAADAAAARSLLPSTGPSERLQKLVEGVEGAVQALGSRNAPLPGATDWERWLADARSAPAPTTGVAALDERLATVVQLAILSRAGRALSGAKADVIAAAAEALDAYAGWIDRERARTLHRALPDTIPGTAFAAERWRAFRARLAR